jgi:hypothetical protein
MRTLARTGTALLSLGGATLFRAACAELCVT